MSKHFFFVFAASLLVGCAAQSSPDSEDEVTSMQAEGALSAYGKQLVGDYKAADAVYPRFSLAKDGTYVWDSGIRCVKAPCPSGDAGRFQIYVGAFSGTRYVNLRSNDGKVERWLRVASLVPTKLVGAFGTTGSYVRNVAKPTPGCASYTDCNQGEQCLAGTCTARPLCVQIPVATDRYLAKNFAAGSWAEASAWAEKTAAGAGHSISLATCTEVAAGLACTADYAPLCTFVSGAEGATTVSNECEMRRAVIAAAGDYGEATALSQKGACTKGEPRCSTYWLKSDPAAVPGAYYAHTFPSDFEANAWIALASTAVEGKVLNGACPDFPMCTKIYKPVCGAVRSDALSTFGNLCEFQAAVRASSATDGWSKGWISAAGSCP